MDHIFYSNFRGVGFGGKYHGICWTFADYSNRSDYIVQLLSKINQNNQDRLYSKQRDIVYFLAILDFSSAVIESITALVGVVALIKLIFNKN